MKLKVLKRPRHLIEERAYNNIFKVIMFAFNDHIGLFICISNTNFQGNNVAGIKCIHGIKNKIFDFAKVEKNNKPAGIFQKKNKVFDNQQLAGYFQKNAKKMQPTAERMNICRIFAPSLNQTYITKNATAFFMPTKEEFDYRPVAGSCCKTLSAGSKKRAIVFFILLFFSAQMNQPTKNATRTMKVVPAARRSHETAKRETATRRSKAGEPPVITVIITGKQNNRYIHALWKATYELFEELTKGYIFTEHRFIKKFDAARTLFPEDLKAIRGLTVKSM